MINAPNRRPGNAQPHLGDSTWEPPNFILTGPPPANLSVIHFPPADYHLKGVSKLELDAQGILALRTSILPEINRHPHTHTPIHERGTIFILTEYGQHKEDLLGWACRAMGCRDGSRCGRERKVFARPEGTFLV
jgi:hypothetical protein